MSGYPGCHPTCPDPPLTPPPPSGAKMFKGCQCPGALHLGAPMQRAQYPDHPWLRSRPLCANSVILAEALVQQSQGLRDALLEYGARNLGCAAITPVWLSYYTDGDEQELHCDVPHGAYAFVLSLTDWKHRRFTGGETVMLRDETLEHWKRFFEVDRDDPQHPSQVCVLCLPHGVCTGLSLRNEGFLLSLRSSPRANMAVN